MPTAPFMGEIMIHAAQRPIQDFAECEGTMLQIANNHALFSLLGTDYGGDGRTTFGIPDLRGRAPFHRGPIDPPTGRDVPVGTQVGQASVSLSVDQLPAHNHAVDYNGSAGSATLTVQKSDGDVQEPESSSYLAEGVGQTSEKVRMYTNKTGSEQTIAGVSGGGFEPSKLKIQDTGKNQDVHLLGPRLAVSFLISLNGTYPPSQ